MVYLAFILVECENQTRTVLDYARVNRRVQRLSSRGKEAAAVSLSHKHEGMEASRQGA